MTTSPLARLVPKTTILLAFAVGGCAASAEIDASGTEARTDVTSSALVSFNPCHPDWQLPTSARKYLRAEDPNFVAFEDRLQTGGARWVGSFTLPEPYRAISRVDHYLSGTKEDAITGLWYLAAVPAGSRDALAAVDDYAAVDPVNSRVLGYCASGRFVRNDGSGPGTLNVEQVIVEYDPRCICFETPTAIMSTWVNPATYYALPRF